MSLRWAARYAFSEDLWRSRARVVLDPALEAALLSGMPVGEDAESLRDLVDALLPAREGEGRAFMAVSDEGVARRFARLRPGTQFVPIDRLPEVLDSQAWDVALLDLDAATPALEEGENPASAAFEWLGVRAGPQRSVVVWAAAGEGGLEYGDLAEAMMEHLFVRGCVQRIYGLYQPPMAAVVDFGESLEVEENDDLEITLTVHPSELRGDDEDDEVPLYYDNSLGAQEPGMDELLGVCTAVALPEGLGLVELPAAAMGQPSGIRAQLASAQERAQRAEVERQELLDRLDALQRENRELRDAVEAGPDPFDALARDEALEASMAREQALKWKVSGLEHQLSQAVARPVEALEAEVARLSALPSPAAEQTAVSGDFEASFSIDDEARIPAELEAESVVLLVRDHARDRALAHQLRGLVRRLERGGIGVLALRRELDVIARRLRN